MAHFVKTLKQKVKTQFTNCCTDIVNLRTEFKKYSRCLLLDIHTPGSQFMAYCIYCVHLFLYDVFVLHAEIILSYNVEVKSQP